MYCQDKDFVCLFVLLWHVLGEFPPSLEVCLLWKAEALPKCAILKRLLKKCHDQLS